MHRRTKKKVETVKEPKRPESLRGFDDEIVEQLGLCYNEKGVQVLKEIMTETRDRGIKDAYKCPDMDTLIDQRARIETLNAILKMIEDSYTYYVEK